MLARSFGSDIGNIKDDAKKPRAFYKTNLMDECLKERRTPPQTPCEKGTNKSKKDKGIVATLFGTSTATCSAVVSHHLSSLFGRKRKLHKFRTDSDEEDELDKFYNHDKMRRRSSCLQGSSRQMNIDADDLNSECAAPTAATHDAGGEDDGLNSLPGCEGNQDQGVPNPPKRRRKSAAKGRGHGGGDVPHAPPRASKEAHDTGLPPSWLSVTGLHNLYDDDDVPSQYQERQQHLGRGANLPRSSSIISSSTYSTSSSSSSSSYSSYSSGIGKGTCVPVHQQAAVASRAKAQEMVLSFVKNTAKKQEQTVESSAASIKEEAHESSRIKVPTSRSSRVSQPRQDASRPGKNAERSVSFSAVMPDPAQQKALMLARTLSSSSSSSTASSSASSSCSTRSGAVNPEEVPGTWTQTLGTHRSQSSMDEKAKAYRAKIAHARRSEEQKQLKQDGCRVKKFMENHLKSPTQECQECEMCQGPNHRGKQAGRKFGSSAGEKKLCASCSMDAGKF